MHCALILPNVATSHASTETNYRDKTFAGKMLSLPSSTAKALVHNPASSTPP